MENGFGPSTTFEDGRGLMQPYSKREHDVSGQYVYVECVKTS